MEKKEQRNQKKKLKKQKEKKIKEKGGPLIATGFREWREVEWLYHHPSPLSPP